MPFSSTRVGLAWCVLLASACAPSDELEPLPIDVCGQDTPKQILALGDDEFVDPNTGVAQFGDRWLFGVRRFEIPLTSIESTNDSVEVRPFAQLDARVESVGPCGEDRRIVAHDVDYLIPPRADDAPWLGCRRDTGDLYWIDPDGARPEIPIASVRSCPQVTSRGHDLFFLAQDGDFIGARLGDDGVTTDVLVTDVVQTSGTSTIVDGEPAPTSDIFLLRGETRSLVSLDFATREVTEILDRVDEFKVSGDRRFVMAVRRIPDDPNDSSVPSAQLWDLEWNSSMGYGAPGAKDVTASLDESVAWVQQLDAAGLPSAVYVVTIPALRTGTLEPGTAVHASDGDDRIVVMTPGGAIELVELSTGDRQPLRLTQLPYVDGAAAYYDDSTRYAALDVPEEYRPKDVVRMPLATLDPEVVYERIFSAVELSDDRWLARSQADANALADLVLIDADSLEIRRVDRHIVPNLRPYELHLGLEYEQPWLTDDLVYEVHERASDRGGMWRVRFAE